MSEKFQLKAGISEPSSDILPQWRDMRSEFEYKSLYEIDYTRLVKKLKGIYYEAKTKK
ncbi:MAG: hypothetical protein KAV25_05960 [Methanophagales archaeon]|nr:hypothetical protein [Methanophagales archaeon]